MKKVFFTLLVSLFATVSISAQSRVEERSMKSEILGVEKTFSVYLPDGYDDDNSTRYPVLYLLHGAFGQNTDWHTHADLQLIADRMIAADSVRPMIVVMPDARGVAKNLAGENMGYFNVEGRPYEDYFFEEFIPYIEKTFRVDTARESRAIAGLSMGGMGTFDLVCRYPNLFAAAAPICGGVNPVRLANFKGKTAFSVYHGADDTVVDVQFSRDAVEALKKAGVEVRYKEYPGVNHNSWDNAFAEPDFLGWFFSHSL